VDDRECGRSRIADAVEVRLGHRLAPFARSARFEKDDDGWARMM
jgi:hypothetical protein